MPQFTGLSRHPAARRHRGAPRRRVGRAPGHAPPHRRVRPPRTAGRAHRRGLTEREREVLTLIARGLSNTEVGQHLHITLGTVKTHVGRLLSKLNARDRAQLVISAYEAGVVSPGA